MNDFIPGTLPKLAPIASEACALMNGSMQIAPQLKCIYIYIYMHIQFSNFAHQEAAAHAVTADAVKVAARALATLHKYVDR